MTAHQGSGKAPLMLTTPAVKSRCTKADAEAAQTNQNRNHRLREASRVRHHHFVTICNGVNREPFIPVDESFHTRPQEEVHQCEANKCKMRKA